MSLYFLPHWRCNLASLADLKGTCSSSLSSLHISCATHLRHEPALNDVRKATRDKLSFSKRGRHSLQKQTTLKASPCIGLRSKVWQVAVLQGWRRFQKLPPCLTEPVADGSKTDPELAKPEPISKAGGTSLPTYLRREKNVQQLWDGSENKWEKHPCRPPTVKEGEDVLQPPEQRFPCSLGGRPRWGSCAPTAHGDNHVRTEIHIQPVRAHAPGRSCSPWKGAQAEAGFLTGTMAAGHPRWSRLFLTDRTSWRRLMLTQYMKDCLPWEDPILEQENRTGRNQW